MENDNTIIIERPMTKEEKDERAKLNKEEKLAKEQELIGARREAYVRISDPIFMQYQRGEATEQAWLDAVQAVKDANPYPVEEA